MIDMEKIIQAAFEKQQAQEKKKEKKKKEQKAQRRAKAKPTSQMPKPEERLNLERIRAIYERSGMNPMRGRYWFKEPRQDHPVLRRDSLSKDGKFATPFGALALLRRQELMSEDNDEPQYQKDFSSFVVEWENWRWLAGQLAQLCKFTCSYYMGFESGWDGNPPGHRLCSKHYHVGYEDGKKAAETFQSEGLLPPLVEDPHSEVEDPAELDELYRCRGYIREGYVPYDKGKQRVEKSAKELRREKMRGTFGK